jgi:hypothetical protein
MELVLQYFEEPPGPLLVSLRYHAGMYAIECHAIVEVRGLLARTPLPTQRVPPWQRRAKVRTAPLLAECDPVRAWRVLDGLEWVSGCCLVAFQRGVD